MFQQPQQRALDELNRFLLITGLIGSVAAMFLAQIPVARYICSGLSSVFLVLAILRMFSKNPQKRYQENLKYLTLTTGVRTFFRNLFAWRPKNASASGSGAAPKTHRAHKARKNPTWSEIKQYKYLICPQCTQRLRVPRGKGRLRVTCTRCGNVFETKS